MYWLGIVSKVTCLEVEDQHHVIVDMPTGPLSCGMSILSKLHPSIVKGYESATHISQTETQATLRIIPAPSSKASVQSIIYDSQTGMIMAAYEGLQQVWRLDASTGQCLAVFCLGLTMGTLSCMKWDISRATPLSPQDDSPKYNRKKTALQKALATGCLSARVDRATAESLSKTTRLLATGDTAGIICLWDGDAVSDAMGSIQPLRVLCGYESPISAIYLDACKLVSGSDDGWIRIWDPLTGDQPAHDGQQDSTTCTCQPR